VRLISPVMRRGALTVFSGLLAAYSTGGWSWGVDRWHGAAVDLLAVVVGVASGSTLEVDAGRWEIFGVSVRGEADLPAAVVVQKPVVSRRRGFHPPPLVEPCVTLSRHTAPVVEPDGSAPCRQ